MLLIEIDASTTGASRYSFGRSASCVSVGGSHYPSSTYSRRALYQQNQRSSGDLRTVTKAGLFGRKKKAAEIEEPSPEAPVEETKKYNPEDSFESLGPIGKSIARLTMVATSALMEYTSGFMTGIVFGSLAGLPGFFFNPVEKGVNQAFMTEMGGRFSRMNGRSLRWAKSFGEISAIFGASQVAVRLMRHGKEDAWTSIFSSALAGACFARKGKLHMAQHQPNTLSCKTHLSSSFVCTFRRRGPRGNGSRCADLRRFDLLNQHALFQRTCPFGFRRTGSTAIRIHSRCLI